MNNPEKLEKIIFYFENACPKTHKSADEYLMKKVRKFLQQMKPEKLWEEVGVINKKLHRGVYPDFVIILDGKVIACEVERQKLSEKYSLYDGIEIFDEIWFFTDIRIEEKHLHYKFENNLSLPQKFFGLNENSEIVNIK